MRATRVLRLLVRAILGMVAIMGAIEVGARLWPLPTSDLRGLHELRPDRPRLFGLRPHARQPIAGIDAEYAINPDGFRGPPIERPKPPDRFRIAVVGDSLAFGWAVADEDTFGSQLERRLQAWSGEARIEVINLGVSGYNPFTEAKWLAEIGPAIEPDLVVVQFCVNDLNDPTLHFDYATRTPLRLPDEAFPDPAQRPPPPTLAERWCAASRACSLVRARFPTRAEQTRALVGIAPHGAPTPSELAWLGERYSELAHTATALGARLAVVVFPYSTQLEPSAETTLQASLDGLGLERGWPTFDLLPAYRRARANTPGAALFIDLWHPTARGYAVAADALATGLACSGLVPVSPPAALCEREGSLQRR